DVLHREADPGGLAFFSSALDNGQANRSMVALAIQSSPEYQTNEVQSLYQLLLHRPADPTGLATFTSFLAVGGTLEQAEAIVAGSSEYLQTRAGGSNDSYL